MGDLVVYGGSFDPPHVGHLLSVVSVIALGRAGEVLLVPSAAHPFGKGVAPFGDRLAMCRLLAQECPGGRVAASAIERDEGLSGRTLDTLRAIAKARPGARLRMLIGADILRERDAWHRFDEIERLAPPIVVGRGVGVAGEGYDVLPAVSPVSSQLVRVRIAAGEDCSSLVPASILAYIAGKGLYRRSRPPSGRRRRSER